MRQESASSVQSADLYDFWLDDKTMLPGEIFVEPGEIELNVGRPVLNVDVANTGDRPIQVGSHFHFYEVNEALDFDRALTRGPPLNRAARSAVPFEPAQESPV